MKIGFVLMAALCSFANAQQYEYKSIGGGSGTITLGPGGAGSLALEPHNYDGKPSAFILQFSYTEKCYECAVRYAMVCIGGNDCNTPDVTRKGTMGFDSAEDALLWANTSMAYKNFKIVSLGKVIDVPVKRKVTRTEIPQPAKVEEKVEYSTEDGKPITTSGSLTCIVGVNCGGSFSIIK